MGTKHLYSKEEAKKRCESWIRYTEDFFRRFVDPVGRAIPHHIARSIFILVIYLLSACLIYLAMKGGNA